MSKSASPDKFTIEQRIRAAIRRLDLTSQFIVQSLFGVLGCNSQTSVRVAKDEEVSEATIDHLQADALRALMGYGPKAIHPGVKKTTIPTASENLN